jgi:hypothetical protein
MKRAAPLDPAPPARSRAQVPVEDYLQEQMLDIHPQHVVDHWDQATEEEKAHGLRWYEDAHHLAHALTAGDPDIGAGVLSVYSQNTPWPANLFNAARSFAEKRPMNKGEGNVTGHMSRTVARILEGEHWSEILKTPKLWSFARLISTGGRNPDTGGHLPDVVIDRHAISVAAGRRMAREDQPLVKSIMSKPDYYEHVANAYRAATDQINETEGQEYAPHQVQAVSWVVRQRLNEEEIDQKGTKKERSFLRVRQNTNSDWHKQWSDYVRSKWPGATEENVHDPVMAARGEGFGPEGRDQWNCEYEHHGTDTDGTDYYRCTVHSTSDHDELTVSPDAPCEGFQEEVWDPINQRGVRAEPNDIERDWLRDHGIEGRRKKTAGWGMCPACGDPLQEDVVEDADANPWHPECAAEEIVGGGDGRFPPDALAQVWPPGVQITDEDRDWLRHHEIQGRRRKGEKVSTGLRGVSRGEMARITASQAAALQPIEAVDRAASFSREDGWFDGSEDAIRERAQVARVLAQKCASAASDPYATEVFLVEAADAEAEMEAEADKLDEIAEEYSTSNETEYLANLPGGTIARDYGNLIEGGLVDLVDDGSWLYGEAAKVQAEAKAYDWEAFAVDGAEQWAVEHVGSNSPDLYLHEIPFREAAVDWARDKTMPILDPERRAKIVDRFVTSAEQVRRREARKIVGSVTKERTANRGQRGSAVDTILKGEPEVLWW